MLLLVDDTYADTLKQSLPADKAWVLDARYDEFRCRVRLALDGYRTSPDAVQIYHETIEDIDTWLAEQRS
ncbi:MULTISPECIES: hypothetical protein [Sulfurimonas]|uniref:Uncharacterized protein n=1 Tax=Sulfurimonas diazotrophicus TaxID=3131939 RepID=A0ABZ3H920_9BACT